jgi:hypothetical protein
MMLETYLFSVQSHHLRGPELMQINRAMFCPGKLIIGISAACPRPAPASGDRIRNSELD